jgi:hypothetical protein
MRLLRFDFRDDLASVDLHPLITVLSDVDPRHQRQLFEAIRRLSSGSTVGLRGLVEHQGLLVELDSGTGDPLGSVTTSAPVLVYVDGLAIEGGEIGLQAEIARWERQAAIDAVTVEEIRSDLDLGIRARLAELGIEPGGEPTALLAVSPGQLLEATIEQALDTARLAEREVAQCPPAVRSLIDRWESYCQRRHVVGDHLFQLRVAVDKAEAMVQDRSRALEAAEAATVTARSGPWDRGSTAADEAAVLDARAALESAVGALDRARAAEDTDSAAAALRSELAALVADCRPILGADVPDDLGLALSAFVTVTETAEWIDATNDLRDVLSSNGVHPPFGLEPDELLKWTEAWLVARRSSTHDRPSSSGRGVEASEQATGDEVDSALIGELSHILARHNRAMAQIDRAELRSIQSAERVAELRAQLEARTTSPQASTAAEVIAMVAPVAERILCDVGGSLPIAVIGDMSGLPGAEVEAMMGAFEEIAQQVQVILVTSHSGIVAWADRAGLQRAGTASGVRAVGTTADVAA